MSDLPNQIIERQWTTLKDRNVSPLGQSAVVQGLLRIRGILSRQLEENNQSLEEARRQATRLKKGGGV